MKTKIDNSNSQLETALREFKPDFNPGFEARIMEKINVLKPISYNQIFTRSFHRISLIGAAAVIALLISIVAAEGSLSTDVLIGLNSMDMETATSMIISGF